MDVVDAIDAWISQRLTTKEVFMITGFRSVRALYEEVRFDRQDRENEEEMKDMSAFHAAVEADELEAEARYQFHHFLQEHPDRVDDCVRALRHEKKRQLIEIGRRFSNRAA
ncbi:hypothetical protein HJB89_25260 [Rhizobium sp. NZLR8]|uniref:hypothetical protein n=1 Tax=Rhizobium sp. NZLR8 TaxID=2731104 RepID=UPI001C8379CF|nr:hypothetical protein [Rhizobium sp. NZLR8]MBX5160396.1 hypothetical protein [Rhizobium sp. NZLR8]